MELKNCPFCGGSAVGFEHSNDSMTRFAWEIYCTLCEASICVDQPDAEKEDVKELAKKLWNNRVK